MLCDYYYRVNANVPPEAIPEPAPLEGTCPNGHERTLENTYESPKTGKRQCLICKREGNNASHARRKKSPTRTLATA